MRLVFTFLLLISVLGGCAHKHEEAVTHEDETHARTIWTAKTELFMEYDEPKPGQKTEFLIHLTDLADFKPVTEGPLVLSFAPAQGEPVMVTVDKPTRPGIFKAEVTFRQPGVHILTMSLKGNKVSDEINVPDITVIGEWVAHDEAHHEGPSGGDISFLKEQQWTVDFMTGLPSRKAISSSFIVAGEIIPAANAEATVSSPVAGVVSLAQRLPFPGKRVRAGEVLALIDPPVSQEGGFGHLAASHAEAKHRVLLAEKEYERAKRLYEAKAVPKRRIEEAELGLESARAAFEPLDRAMREMRQGSEGNKVIIRAPQAGTVVELTTANGRYIEAGQPLLRVINTSAVWLRANVPSSETGSLGNLDKATFTIPGVEGVLRPTHLVAVNDMVDAKTRTVPVIFEVRNPEGKIKVGMFADISITTGHAVNALTLPEEALFEDEGRFFVFVQGEGESFERREVKAGIRGSGLVQILSGVTEEERIVVRGGYYVKLAALSSRMAEGDGHGHAH